jgi:hypothetical protein
MQSTTYEPHIALPGSLLGFFGLFISCILVLIIYLSDGLYYFIWTSCFFSRLLAQVILGLGSGLAFILFKHKFLLFLELLMNNLMDMDLSSSKNWSYLYNSNITELSSSLWLLLLSSWLFSLTLPLSSHFWFGLASLSHAPQPPNPTIKQRNKGKRKYRISFNLFHPKFQPKRETW